MKNKTLTILGTASIAFMLMSSIALAAKNPSGTGQPGAECGDANATVEPNGFSTDGFANAEQKYAGSGQSTHSGNDKAVSQYDVACYQLSN